MCRNVICRWKKLADPGGIRGKETAACFNTEFRSLCWTSWELKSLSDVLKLNWESDQKAAWYSLMGKKAQSESLNAEWDSLKGALVQEDTRQKLLIVQKFTFNLRFVVLYVIIHMFHHCTVIPQTQGHPVVKHVQPWCDSDSCLLRITIWRLTLWRLSSDVTHYHSHL